MPKAESKVSIQMSNVNYDFENETLEISCIYKLHVNKEELLRILEHDDKEE